MKSEHYIYDRMEREMAIDEIGEGVVLHSEIIYDEKRGRNFLYEISSTALLTVKSADREDFIITRYYARPSRIKKYWADASSEILKISVANTRRGLVF